jgi:hypothetical protein
VGSKSETREVVILIERAAAAGETKTKTKGKKGKGRADGAGAGDGAGDGDGDGDGPTLALAYVALGASFSAAYDMRVTRGDTAAQDALDLTYFGVIKNSTEEDWAAAQLTLSTAKPSVGGGPPRLPPAKVHFKVAAVYGMQATFGGMQAKSKKRGGMRHEMVAQSMAMPSMAASRRRSVCDLDEGGGECSESSEEDDECEEWGADGDAAGGGGGGGGGPSARSAPRISAAKAAGTGTGSTVFQLPKRVTIEADGKPHKQPIDSLALAVTFTTCISPKVSPHCFVKASARNTSTLPLLPGPMSVFVNGAFVTNSEIEAVGPSETFACYLGVDDAVRISYSAPKVTRVAAGGGIMSKKTTTLETVTQLATIKNAKPVEIRVVVYEQLPTSSTETIKVKLIEPQLSPSGGNGGSSTRDSAATAQSTKINSSGNLEWRFTVAAQSERETKFEYSIEYPKDQKIEISG